MVKAPLDSWSALGLRKPKPLAPEKLATLLPKLRKGADASLSMGQLVAVAWHLGWTVEPLALVVPYQDHPHDKSRPEIDTDGGEVAFAESQRQWRLAKALPGRPERLALGETAIYDVSPLARHRRRGPAVHGHARRVGDHVPDRVRSPP